MTEAHIKFRVMVRLKCGNGVHIGTKEGMMTFESYLKYLFDNAIDVEDTIWYDEHQTLFDAIVEMYEEMHAHEN